MFVSLAILAHAFGGGLVYMSAGNLLAVLRAKCAACRP
jgi:hypothetical protein